MLGSGWFSRLAGACSLTAMMLILAAATAAASEQAIRLAQVYPAPYPASRTISPHEINAIVRSLGLIPVSHPRPRGPAWIVRALGREGTVVRVMIDGASGQVVEIVQLGPNPPQMARVIPGPAPGYGEPLIIEGPEYLDSRRPPVPPASVPRASGGSPNSGPQVITRNSDHTGSVPVRLPAAASSPADPLIGVPPEFRRGAARNASAKEGQAIARIPSDAAKRTMPLPRLRPSDLPMLVTGSSNPSAAGSASKTSAETSPQTSGEAIESNPWPPMQTLE